MTVRHYEKVELHIYVLICIVKRTSCTECEMIRFTPRKNRKFTAVSESSQVPSLSTASRECLGHSGKFEFIKDQNAPLKRCRVRTPTPSGNISCAENNTHSFIYEDAPNHERTLKARKLQHTGRLTSHSFARSHTAAVRISDS